MQSDGGDYQQPDSDQLHAGIQTLQQARGLSHFLGEKRVLKYVQQTANGLLDEAVAAAVAGP